MINKILLLINKNLKLVLCTFILLYSANLFNVETYTVLLRKPHIDHYNKQFLNLNSNFLEENILQYMKNNLVGVEFKIEYEEKLEKLLKKINNGKADFGAPIVDVDIKNYKNIELSHVYNKSPYVILSKVGAKKNSELVKVGIMDNTNLFDIHRNGVFKKNIVITQTMTSTNFNKKISNIVNENFDHILVNQHVGNIITHLSPHIKSKKLENSANLSFLFNKKFNKSNKDSLNKLISNYMRSGLDYKLSNAKIKNHNLSDYEISKLIERSKLRLVKYRKYFYEASKLTGFDWRLLAALSYQESHWNQNAVSYTGVRGLMMLTKSTASMMNVTDRTDPKESILGGSKYLLRLYNRLPERIDSTNRILLALAAYNMGMAHLHDVRILTQRFGGNPDLWSDVKMHLPKLQRKQFYKSLKNGYARGKEALELTENVKSYYFILSQLFQKPIILSKLEINNTIN